jgi:CubicO group peptidase (beta-lactamase class C family)
MSIPHGAGSVVSTPTDLTLFIRALFTGKLITQASLDEMTKTDDQKYGKGIFAIPFFEEKGLGHTGGIDEFSSMLVYFPEEELALAFCSNASNYGVKSTVKGVLSMYYGMPYELPVFKTVKVEQDVLKKYEGRFSMAGVPLKITIRLQKNLLTAQADGQGEFPLEPVSQTEFHFDAAGVIINFTADGNAFTFRQSGTTLIMTKEK